MNEEIENLKKDIRRIENICEKMVRTVWSIEQALSEVEKKVENKK